MKRLARTLVLFSVAAWPVACTKFRRAQKDDQRTTAVPTAEAPQPSPGGEAPAKPLPPVPGPKPLDRPLGAFQLADVHCSGNVVEKSTLGLKLMSDPQAAVFVKAVGDDCVAKQGVTMTMEVDKVRLDYGATACEGACSSPCPATAFGENGKSATFGYTPVTGGFSLGVDGLAVPGHCAGALVLSLAFSEVDPTTPAVPPVDADPVEPAEPTPP